MEERETERKRQREREKERDSNDGTQLEKTERGGVCVHRVLRRVNDPPVIHFYAVHWPDFTRQKWRNCTLCAVRARDPSFAPLFLSGFLSRILTAAREHRGVYTRRFGEPATAPGQSLSGLFSRLSSRFAARLSANDAGSARDARLQPKFA